MFYSHLSSFRRYLGFTDTETSDDDRLILFLDRATTGINYFTGRRFDVYYQTMKFDYPTTPRNLVGIYDVRRWVEQMNAVGDLNRRSLATYIDFVTVDTVVNGDGTTILPASYVLEPTNIYPKNKITLTDSSTNWNRPGRNYKQIISVSGIWGYIKDPTYMWVNSGDGIRNGTGIDIDDTAITITAWDGVDENFKSPRFGIGQMLKLADGVGYEYLLIQSIVPGTNDTLYVKRGYNGTTARAWIKDTTIYTFSPWPNVEQACTRFAEYLYRRKDTDEFDKQASPGGGLIPSAIPKDIAQLLPPRPIKIKPY